jgi:protein tyrosine phosphatase
VLADLLSPPKTPQDWERYDLAHRKSHEAIIAAAQAKGVSLTSYVLSPITDADLVGFLQRNQQEHLQMDALAGVQNIDLQDVNFGSEEQVADWVYLHWQDHYNVEQFFGISS